MADIKQRAERLGLSLNSLALCAGVDPSILYRAARGEGRTGFDGVRTVYQELARREIALRDHLLGLHPLDRVVTRIDARELARLADDGCLSAPDASPARTGGPAS